MSELSPLDWALRPLKRYATFSGRAPRAEYWWFYLMTVILGTPARLIDRVLGTPDVFVFIFDLAILLPLLAVTVRRLHDTNRSGIWLLLGVVLIVVFVIAAGISNGLSEATTFGSIGLVVGGLLMLALIVTFLIFMVLPGTEGPNDYGPDPFGPDGLEEVFA